MAAVRKTAAPDAVGVVDVAGRARVSPPGNRGRHRGRWCLRRLKKLVIATISTKALELPLATVPRRRPRSSVTAPGRSASRVVGLGERSAARSATSKCGFSDHAATVRSSQS